MDLKSLLVDSKTTWAEFPGLDGFEVELANLSRKELMNLRKKCTSSKFNRKTREYEESLERLERIKTFILRRLNFSRFIRTRLQYRDGLFTRKCSCTGRKFFRV
jgi:hypothetical protein